MSTLCGGNGLESEECDIILVKNHSKVTAQSTEVGTYSECVGMAQSIKLSIIDRAEAKGQERGQRVMEWLEKKGVKAGLPQNIRNTYSSIQKDKIRCQQSQLWKSSRLIRPNFGKDVTIFLE